MQSPQLLELSGIGGRALLEKHGIPVVVENPNVGEYMQDHPLVCQSFEVADHIPWADQVIRDQALAKALLDQHAGTGEGPMGACNLAVVNIALADGDRPLDNEARTQFLDMYMPKVDSPVLEKERR